VSQSLASAQFMTALATLVVFGVAYGVGHEVRARSLWAKLGGLLILVGGLAAFSVVANTFDSSVFAVLILPVLIGFGVGLRKPSPAV